MNVYWFSATDRVGRRYEGRILAKDEEDAYEKLHQKGYYAKKLKYEGLAEGEFRASEKAVKKIFGIPVSEIPTYGIPLIGIIIAIVGIFVAVRFLNPEIPSVSPENTVQEYFSRENSAAFKKQYELFSRGRQNYFGTPENYEQNRRLMARDGVAALKLKVKGIDAREVKKRHAYLTVHILRSTGLASVQFVLVNAKAKWQIEYVNDPAFVDYYLDLIQKNGGYEANRDLVRKLKLETDLSDLDIRDRLQGYGQKQYEEAWQ